MARHALATDEEEKLVDKKSSTGEGAKLSPGISESLDDFGKDEQERRAKVTINIKEGKKTGTMEPLFKILYFVLKFDLRDNPN